MEWLNLPVQVLSRYGGWGLVVIGLVALLVASWRGLIVGGAEHQRALEQVKYWRDFAERQTARYDVLQDALESVQTSVETMRGGVERLPGELQRTVEAVVRALPRNSGRR